ncbi:MAG: hypothetical protein KME37_09275 [Candidatus Thiodiazotropha sp. (ex Codakia orbicularis)]|nr:hypothetical protein [Candidatus Thiodiazotropha sp. (ex Codakia orbicularis)]
MKWLFNLLEPYIQAAITGRILKFHDHLVERGQIPGHKKQTGIIACCMEYQNSDEDQFPRLDEPASRP